MRSFSGPLSGELSAYNAFRISQGYCEDTHALPLQRFDRYTAEAFPAASELTREIAFGWLKHETDAGMRPAKDRLAALRGFANYINAIGGRAYVLPLRLNPPQVRQAVRIPTDAEMSALFTCIDRMATSRKEVHGLFQTLFRLMYTCGLRPGEAIGLKRTDIDLGNGTARIIDSKFHKDRSIAMSADMIGQLRRYIRRLDATSSKDEYLFPGRKKSPIRTAVVSRFLNRCWTEAQHDLGDDHPRRIRLYDFRHRFASAVLHKWLDEGRNIYEALPMLRVYMGHVTILSTLYYVHLLPENLLKSRSVRWEEMESIIPEVES